MEPFIGQIEIYGFNFPPRDWAFAAGQLIAIRQNTALFSLIGTNFGGDGVTTFALPNLASLQACGSGQGPNLSQRSMGDQFGEFAVTLTTAEMPMHTHAMNIQLANGSEVVTPSPDTAIGTVETTNFNMYAAAAAAAVMNPTMVQPAGGGQPHMNTQPYLALNFSIALQGNFPSFS